jgi:hypothetical protein
VYFDKVAAFVRLVLVPIESCFGRCHRIFRVVRINVLKDTIVCGRDAANRMDGKTCISCLELR